MNETLRKALEELDEAIAAYKAREEFDAFAGLDVPCDDHGSEG